MFEQQNGRENICIYTQFPYKFMSASVANKVYRYL